MTSDLHPASQTKPNPPVLEMAPSIPYRRDQPALPAKSRLSFWSLILAGCVFPVLVAWSVEMPRISGVIGPLLLAVPALAFLLGIIGGFRTRHRGWRDDPMAFWGVLLATFELGLLLLMIARIAAIGRLF